KVQPAQPSEGGGYKPETAEEREARLRQAAIYVKAFKLAAPPAAGTPFEGKLFFDAGFDSWDIAEDEDDETMLVASVTLRIPKAEVDAQMAEAERRYELEQQELREEDEALAAEIEGDGPEPAPAEAGDGEAGDEADLDPNVNDAAAEPEPA
ncbi:MAG TPA: hypothetical protein VEB65_07350, partial [Solirubrobacterales bacterium]|nr:hypothetical protein [Solirubrobacterales bacterium]